MISKFRNNKDLLRIFNNLKFNLRDFQILTNLIGEIEQNAANICEKKFKETLIHENKFLL